MPAYTKADAIMAAAQTLMKILIQEADSNIVQHDKEKLIELATIFQNVANKLPQNEAEKESATIINNKEKPRVDIKHKHIHTTAQQQYQTQEQNKLIQQKMHLL